MFLFWGGKNASQKRNVTKRPWGKEARVEGKGRGPASDYSQASLKRGKKRTQPDAGEKVHSTVGRDFTKKGQGTQEYGKGSDTLYREINLLYRKGGTS